MLGQLGGGARALFALAVVAGVLAVIVGSRSGNQEALFPTTIPATSVPAAPTATVVPTKTPDELKASADYVDPRRLAAGPEDYVGQNVYLQGEALNVEQEDDYTWVQLMAQVRDRSVTESIVVVLVPPDLDVLKAECYRFYGVVAGTTETRTLLTGVTNDQAQVTAYTYEPSERSGAYGCAPLQGPPLRATPLPAMIPTP